MNNTPTPRTDARQTLKDIIGDEYVSVDFSRRLERELTAAREELKAVTIERDEFHVKIEELAIKLQAVTEQRDEYKAALQSADNHNHEIATKLEIVTEQRDRLLNFVQKSIPRHTLACVSQPEPQTSPWTFHMDDKGKPIITEDSCVCSPEVKAIRRLLKDGKGFNTARIAAVKGGADE